MAKNIGHDNMISIIFYNENVIKIIIYLFLYLFKNRKLLKK